MQRIWVLWGDAPRRTGLGGAVANLPCVSMRTVRLRLVPGPLCPQIGGHWAWTQRLSPLEGEEVLPFGATLCVPRWVQGWEEESPSDSSGH